MNTNTENLHVVKVLLPREKLPHYISYFREPYVVGTPKVVTTADRSQALKLSESSAKEMADTFHRACANYLVYQDDCYRMDGAEYATAVIVEPLIEPKQYYMRLSKVIRRDLPFVQTRALTEQVDSWLTQWTVPNNFKLMLTNNPDKALEHWMREFNASFRSALGTNILNNTEVANHFTFEYDCIVVANDVPFWPTSGRIQKIDCEDIMLDD